MHETSVSICGNMLFDSIYDNLHERVDFHRTVAKLCWSGVMIDVTASTCLTMIKLDLISNTFGELFDAYALNSNRGKQIYDELLRQSLLRR